MRLCIRFHSVSLKFYQRDLLLIFLGLQLIKKSLKLTGIPVFFPVTNIVLSSHGFTSGNMTDGLQFDFRLTRHKNKTVHCNWKAICRVLVTLSNNLVLFCSVQELAI